MNVMRVFLAMALLSIATPCLADELAGTWLRENGDVRIKFEPCGNAICGIIVWLKPDSESTQGRPAPLLRPAARWEKFLERQGRRQRLGLCQQGVARRGKPQHLRVYHQRRVLQVDELDTGAVRLMGGKAIAIPDDTASIDTKSASIHAALGLDGILSSH